jgi:hypothetical protein
LFHTAAALALSATDQDGRSLLQSKTNIVKTNDLATALSAPGGFEGWAVVKNTSAAHVAPPATPPELFALVKAHKLAVARREAQLAALHEAHARFLARKLAEQQALQEARRADQEFKEWCCYVAADIDWKKLCGTDAELEDLCFSDSDLY